MQRAMVPRRVFLTAGTGRAALELESFEMALRDGGLQACNLVCVSSILPPGCRMVERGEGLAALAPGEIVYCVLAQRRSREAGRRLSAALGVARPDDANEYGYLCEHTDGGPMGEAGQVAESRAAQMLATAWGIPAEQAQERSPGAWSAGGKRLTTTSIAREATVGDGEWCTVLSAAVFLP